VEYAVKYAKRHNVMWRREVVLYIIHGILHLLGYRDKLAKDREKMERKQAVLLDKLPAGTFKF